METTRPDVCESFDESFTRFLSVRRLSSRVLFEYYFKHKRNKISNSFFWHSRKSSWSSRLPKMTGCKHQKSGEGKRTHYFRRSILQHTMSQSCLLSISHHTWKHPHRFGQTPWTTNTTSANLNTNGVFETGFSIKRVPSWSPSGRLPRGGSVHRVFDKSVGWSSTWTVVKVVPINVTSKKRVIFV